MCFTVFCLIIIVFTMSIGKKTRNWGFCLKNLIFKFFRVFFFYLSLFWLFFLCFPLLSPPIQLQIVVYNLIFHWKITFLEKRFFCHFLQILIFSEKKVTHGVLELVIPYRIAFMVEFSHIWHVDKLYQTICYISDLITFRSGYLENEDRFCINFFLTCALPL